ncbi:adenylate/guanylate cyclase domain-containing protein [Alphaproteobacteria bacterium]|nr:adenylate/guanylate cyclase domain-containing protein [Alphaproteobacteria bacterium]
MELKEFLNQDKIIDLSFFNFSNAVTAAYFANKNLEVIKVNDNFKKFFPVLKNVTNILFPSILDQLGVPSDQIKNFEKELTTKGKVIIPKIEINIDGQIKIYSLLSAYTENKDFPYLNGIQGQFVDRTEEYNLRKEKEELLDQKLRDQEIIEEKTRKLENIANRLSKYLSPQVYKSIFDEEDIGNENRTPYSRKNLTIFFSDIQNFTDLSDTLEPEKLAEIINNYLSEMTLIAIECGGTIDKFIGDAIMVFFGDPETLGEEQDALRCVDMALKMKSRIEELRDYWNRNGVKGGLNVRMGISTGYCTVGNFGSNQRMDYTALGSPVNLSARLQSLADTNQIVISDTTLNLVENKIIYEKFKEITPKGFARSVQTYKLDDFIDKNISTNKKSYSRKGKHVDINIFDTSNIKEALNELEQLQGDFSKELNKD